MDILDSWNALVVLVVLTVLIVVGLVWIQTLRKDARGEVEDDSQAIYRALKDAYESGQMADSEFEKIRESLGVPPDRWPELRRRPPAPAPSPERPGPEERGS